METRAPDSDLRWMLLPLLFSSWTLWGSVGVGIPFPFLLHLLNNMNEQLERTHPLELAKAGVGIWDAAVKLSSGCPYAGSACLGGWGQAVLVVPASYWGTPWEAESLLPTWKSWMESLAPIFSLAQPQHLWALGKWTTGGVALSPFPSPSSPLPLKQNRPMVSMWPEKNQN